MLATAWIFENGRHRLVKCGVGLTHLDVKRREKGIRKKERGIAPNAFMHNVLLALTCD